MISITELTFLTGERCRVEGEAKDVERLILDAARGSIMQLAWSTDADAGEPVGIIPECVVMLRALTLAVRANNTTRSGNADRQPAGLLLAAGGGIAWLAWRMCRGPLPRVLLACFSTRRSRSRLSRASFAIVVFFLPVEAMSASPFLEVASAAVLTEPTGEGLGAHSSEPNSGKSVQILRARVALHPRDGAVTHSVGLTRREGETTGRR
jgi:hypothetical protein